MRAVAGVVERQSNLGPGIPYLWKFKEAIRWLVREDEVWWEERDQLFTETWIEQRRLRDFSVTLKEHGPTDPATVEALANFVESTPVMMREVKSLTKRFGATTARRMVMEAALQAAQDMIRFCPVCGLEPKRCECDGDSWISEPSRT